MRITNIREFRNKATTYLKENETVLITRHGKITGILYPIKDTDTLPENIRKELGSTLTLTGREEEHKKTILNGLKTVLRIKDRSLPDLEKIRRSWTFNGKLSDEVIAERDKR
jgi:hypothetical protein